MRQAHLTSNFCMVLVLLIFITNLDLRAQIISKPAYKQIDIIKIDGIIKDEQLYNLAPDKKATIIEYVDGLARPIQQIALQASPMQQDIIQPTVYDKYGRKPITYMPYVVNGTGGVYQSNAIISQKAFYSNGIMDKIVDDSKPYATEVFENSPLNRLLKAGNIGEGFHPEQKFKSSSYRTNNSSDNVRLWKSDGTSTSMYSAGSLQVTEFTDEHGNKTWLFKDKLGQNILKRVQLDDVINGVTRTFLETYHIYNDIGQIKYIISPKASAQMQANNNWSILLSQINELIFTYTYDNLGRVVEKKSPGAGPVFIIYDNADRPILVQDANLRLTNKWYYCKYNSKQQVISEGIYTNAVQTSRPAMQAYVGTLNLQINSFEERVSGAAHGYTNQIFPTTQIDELNYYYYDDYDLNRDGVRDFNYQSQLLAGEATPFYQTKGLLTASKTKIVGGTSWLTKVVFYDKRGNTIQELSNNQIFASIADSKTIVPDFSGKILISKTVKSISTTSKTTVQSKFTYDHSNRILAIDDSYNGAAEIKVAAYKYNELGQIVEKNLHGLAGPSASQDHIELGANDALAVGQSKNVVAFKSILLKNGFVVPKGAQFSASINSGYLQSVDYRYDIRGRLTHINNSTLKNDVNNDDDDDLFGMEILYNTLDNSISNVPLYNGLISAVKWKTKGPLENNPKEQSYVYKYDKVYRLNEALYTERITNGSWTNGGAFDEKGIKYDENGNILSLTRNGYISGSITPMDNLTYTYQGNQLTNIVDAGTALQGFKNITGSTAAYIYTTSGSLKSDPKKGISIDYNVLNKDDKITVTTAVGRFIKYTYDGGGILLRKQVYDNNQLKKTTDYIEGFVFEDGVLSFFAMAEGRVRNIGSSLKSEYMLKDHQGNVRLSFEEQNGKAVVRQNNAYYPFGLLMPGNSIPSQPNRNLYNGGAEWQNDFGDLPDYYRTHYRNYDAAVGRFMAIDIRADLYTGLNPYQYALNNPISFNDPLGDKVPVKIPGFDNLWNSNYGGTWSSDGGGSGSYSFFRSAGDGFQAAAAYMDSFGSWGMYGFATDYKSAERIFNSGVRGDHKMYGQKDFITVGTWFRGSDGKATTIDGLSAEMKVIDLREGGKYEQSDVSKLFTSNEVGYLSAPLGPLGDFAESAQRFGGKYLASPGGRVSQRLLKTGEITLRTVAGNINTSAKLVNGIRIGAKWGGNMLGTVGIVFTLERLANDPNYHFLGEGGLDLVFGAAGFIPVYGWAISGTYSLGKAVYEYNKEQ